ncbi:anthrax toxin lethal factor-related metalloendopeptidase [Clostridium beijerinckii]|uniref:Anthrax toxin lethal/endema factor N-/C-terminal domain-containing protein n=1 Tax=Clostridium beijerinckii TaxID=1520 RepID=A0A1S8SA56_CLOBE|nr:hypothetical protein [Clostridium beijerinckii]NRY59837.1 glucan-binding YG repeat protein [Clostridium beijerinckii]OOM62192.1 hypothetical protein CLBCK_18950 [Clostridium beijerinckii]
MKLKKIIISFTASCVIMSQAIIANATVSDQYVDKGYTKKVMAQIHTKFTNNAMQKLNQYSFYVVNQELYKIPNILYRDENSKGSANFENKEVIIYETPNNLTNTIWHAYHEAAHCLDYDLAKDNGELGLYSNTQEYNQISDEEWNNISPYSNYVASHLNIHEEFAESFTMFVMHPDILKNVAPKTFAYLDKLGFVKQSELNSSTSNDITGWSYVNQIWSYSENGKWVNGWKEIDGEWYYFINGTMAKNTTINGYYINDDGVWVA